MNDARLTIIYDGECPFCSSYVSLLRLRDTVKTVELVDARSGDARTRSAINAGHDLNRGMVVLWDERQFFGQDAVHLLATLSGDGGGLNTVQRWLFASPRRAAWIYPLLAVGRRFYLRLTGKTLISLARDTPSER
ncbi:thiol-disulfide oxidoreductase DCC family protein [Hoeflea halophila]|nr:DCC1-like thiol-disulfide oxidoreductase family protein [Hoeflea halophila]